MPRASKIITSIPKEIDEIIFKATAKNPGNRFLTATEFKTSLENFQKGISNKESLLSKLFKKM